MIENLLQYKKCLINNDVELQNHLTRKKKHSNNYLGGVRQHGSTQFPKSQTCNLRSQKNQQQKYLKNTQTHTHTHTHIYIYIYKSHLLFSLAVNFLFFFFVII